MICDASPSLIYVTLHQQCYVMLCQQCYVMPHHIIVEEMRKRNKHEGAGLPLQGCYSYDNSDNLTFFRKTIQRIQRAFY